jgi:hypothetical protein
MKLEDLEAKLGIANMGEEEKLALVKDIQANIPALKAEQRVLEAKTQANLVVEAIKKIKEGLEARFDELNGIVDVKVRDITSGKDGLQGPKGEQGDRGFDGTNGKDGYNGKDGLDGVDGKDGVGVQDAHIDFDGSLIITLTDGTEINVGEVVPMDVAEKIKIIGNGGGTSQSVLDSLTSLQNQINTLTGIDGTLGTMAQQDDTSVDINGGAIDGTTIGGTTPAAGTFTTLTATGQTSLGGAAGSESLRVTTPSSAPNAYVKIFGSPFGFGYITTDGSSASSGLLLSSKGGNQVSTYTNNFAQEQLRVAHTASAVNYVQVTGAATGGLTTISAQGSDTNTYLALQAKANGYVAVANATAASYQALRVATQNAINTGNLIQINPAAAGSAPSIQAISGTAGSDTNIPLVLQPKGTGALQAQQTDSTATGGNARGANAVDWQTIRSGASQVAAGQYGVVSGGISNTVNSVGGVVGGGSGNFVSSSGYVGGIFSGQSNQSNGFYSPVVGGASNQANGYYNFIGGGFTNSATSGSAVTTQSGTMNGTTAVTLSGSNANIKVGQYITGTSIAAETYVAAISGTSLTLSKVASGSSTSTLSFYTPHGVVVGGGNNQATGSYSFIGGGGDAGTAANRNVASGAWSTVGGGTKNVASGAGSVIAGGGFEFDFNFGNTASGNSSFIGGGILNNATNSGSLVVAGWQNTSNGTVSSVVGGRFGSARSITGNVVLSACNVPIVDTLGATQSAVLVLARQTTNATPTVLCSDPSGATTTNQVILPNNSAYYFRGTVVAGVTGGGNTKGWTIEGVIKRGANAASTALVGTATVTSSYADAGASTWALTATADTTNGGLAITFTGQASTTIRCVAKIETTECTY